MNRPYFDMPAQVMFYDIDSGDGDYLFGIAYQDHIICGCCGGVFDIDELYDDTPSDQTPLYTFRGWDNLCELTGYCSHKINELEDYFCDLTEYCTNMRNLHNQMSIFDEPKQK